MLFRVLLTITVATSLLYAGDKPKGASLVKLPTATAEVKGLEVPRPKQACPNWAWAALLELMLAERDFDLKQTYWVLKAFPGELCVESPVNLDYIRDTVKGDYVLMDGRHVHLSGVVTKGAPTDVGYLIANLREGHPLMLLWRGRPVLLQSIDYDEYVYPNDQRMFEALKLTMIDPLDDKPVVFEKGTDAMSDLGGVFEVRVGPPTFLH